jgi:hypothetical protein
MRKTLILLVLSLLLLLNVAVRACHRPVAKPYYGDPDEFQAQRYHDETGQRFNCLGGGRSRGRETLRSEMQERRTRQNERRYLSINFAGRTFFLER